MTMKADPYRITVHRRCGPMSIDNPTKVLEAGYPTFGIYTNAPAELIGTGSPRMAAQMLETAVSRDKFKHDDPVNFVYALSPRRARIIPVIEVRKVLTNLADEISYGRKMYKESVVS